MLTALVDVLGVVLADLALVDLLVVSVNVLDWWVGHSDLDPQSKKRPKSKLVTHIPM